MVWQQLCNARNRNIICCKQCVLAVFFNIPDIHPFILGVIFVISLILSLLDIVFSISDLSGHIAMLFFLFGIIGGRRGFVIYHYVNPFNLFNLDFETFSVILTVIITLLVAAIIYRPFCQFICPFGLISWIAEQFSIFRIRIDKEKCTQCGACIKVCPLEAIEGRVSGKKLPADCFSCARCLNVCPVEAIQYTSFLKKEWSKWLFQEAIILKIHCSS